MGRMFAIFVKSLRYVSNPTSNSSIPKSLLTRGSRSCCCKNYSITTLGTPKGGVPIYEGGGGRNGRNTDLFE
jgi:hypothetical protein